MAIDRPHPRLHLLHRCLLRSWTYGRTNLTFNERHSRACAYTYKNIPTFSNRVNVLFTIKYQNFLLRAFFLCWYQTHAAPADVKAMAVWGLNWPEPLPYFCISEYSIECSCLVPLHCWVTLGKKKITKNDGI